MSAERTSPRLLVVDDEPAVRELVELAAEACGYATTSAGCVADVRALGPDGFDLALVDLALGAEDGVAALHVLAARWPRSAVLLMSGAADDVVASAARAGSVDGLHVIDVLHKPFDLRGLRRFLVAWADSRPTDDAPGALVP